MSTIPVFFKSYKPEVPVNDYWDYAFFESLLKHELWTPARHFVAELVTTNDPLPYTDFGIVVIPARYHFDKIKEINEDIAKLGGVLLVLIGDEDGVFPVEEIVHPNKKVWLMLPHNQKIGVDRYLPNGWPTDTRTMLKKRSRNKIIDFFFSGQITHSRREECFAHLTKMQEIYTGEVHGTQGFTQGMEREKYLARMAKAKIVPCPSGAIVPDSFRFYEALEAGCLPLADNKSPGGKGANYWRLLFGNDLPFPVVEEWDNSPLAYHVDTDPTARLKTFAWWQQQKRQWAYNLRDDLVELGMYSSPLELKDTVSVVIPTSYINAHPSTAIIEETITRVRSYLPDSEIFLMFDGLRDPNNAEQKAKYNAYIERMLDICNFEYHNIIPVLFNECTHQIGMTRKVLTMVKTPLILFVEHDTPICDNIDMGAMTVPLLEGKLDVLRFHHEGMILESHEHLMLDKKPIAIGGVPILRTSQWSQRPHLATVEFYNRILNQLLKPDAFGMIEDAVISPIQSAFIDRGQPGWREYRIGIYAPEGNLRRSYHLDGRGNESKFEETFKY